MLWFCYNKVKATIEFHPIHCRNQVLQVPQTIHKDSILWVIDNVQDLGFADDI